MHEFRGVTQGKMRILMITGGSSMAAMIFKAPPQFGQCSMSMSKTRFSSRASSCAPARPALERPRLRSRGRALVERVSPHVDVHVSSLGRLYVYLQSLGRLDFTYHMFSPSKKPSRSRDLIASPALFTGKTAEE
jgi:hypothetical protein